jgi:hypothetical protein
MVEHLPPPSPGDDPARRKPPEPDLTEPAESPGHVYEVRLTGRVEDVHLLGDLDEVQVTERDLRTVLLGEFDDPQQLYDLLRRLRAYGLEVLEIHRVPDPAPDRQEDR